jgi:phage-related protein
LVQQDQNDVNLKTSRKRVFAVFYCSENGKEPVRDWIKALSPADRKAVGDDIKTVEFGFPVGMPICRFMGKGLYEVRSNISDEQISRVLFCIYKEQMILLHGFIKKTQKTPKKDLDLALERKGRVEAKK